MTISVQLINSQTKQPVEGLYLGLYLANSNNPLATLLTDAQGQGQFSVDAAGAYSIHQPIVRDLNFSVCPQQVTVSEGQDVTLSIDADPLVEPTQAERDRFTGAALLAFSQRFTERLDEANGNAQLEEAARGQLVSEMQFLIDYIGVAPFSGSMENSKYYCYQCVPMCTANPKPDYNTCVYNCMYVPDNCKQ